MEYQSVEDKRPYLCPGCELPLPTKQGEAVTHMTAYRPLQRMIAVGRELHTMATP